MINEEKTKEVYGYYSKDLSPKSSKPIIANCDICKNDRVLNKAAYRDKCGYCAKIERIKDLSLASANARRGKPHSQVTRHKIRLTKIGEKNPNWGKTPSQETLHKLSIAHMGEKNGFYGRKHSDETRKKLSDFAKLHPTRLGVPAAHGKGDYYKNIWMRSSWEIKLAEYLDSKDIKWSYESVKFPIVYILNGEVKKGTYICDFKIWEKEEKDYEIWEVKGYWRDDALVKYQAFREQHPEVVCKLLTRTELKTLGLKGIR